MGTQFTKLLALSALSVLALTACGSDDKETAPPKPPVVVVVPPTTPAPLTFVVSGGVINANTGNVITGTVTLSFKEGEVASANVINLSGTAVTSLTTTDGSFAFRLKSGAKPENFSVLVSAAGYLSKSYILDLSDTSAAINTQFELVATNATGLVAATQAATVAAGTVATEIAVQASQSGTSAGVTVPAGTVLQSATGTAIAGTSVSMNVATAAKAATGDAVKLIDVVPQGLNQGTDNLVRLPVAGASVTMTDNQGNKIKKFSSPVTLNLSVPAGPGVSAGQVLSISSYDEDTGTWKRDEFSATAGPLNTTTNTHPISFQTDHLTFFSAGRNEPVCPSDLKYTVTGTVPAGGLTLYMESSDAVAIGYIGVGVTSGTLLRASTVARYNIHTGAAARVKAYPSGNNSLLWYDSVTEVPICGTVAVGLTNPSTPVVSENFSVNLVCSNDTTVTKALTGALVSYGLTGKPKAQATDNNNGSYSLTSLVQGSNYEVKVEPVGVAGAAVSNFTITANGTGESGNINIACQTGTGAG